MPPLPMVPEDDTAGEAPPPSAEDLLDWHPHIQREPDPRQRRLPL
jgi:hypothetical protein